MKKIFIAALLLATFWILETNVAHAITPRVVTSPFLYTFNVNGKLEEAGSLLDSWSPYFWLNSGGRFHMDGGVGKTVQNALDTGDRWQKAYAAANGLDTGEGYFPQNLFRLVTTSKWKNITQEVNFQIKKINMTDTTNRDGYSGILLMSRYLDGDNLYYAGIRMDGTAVIKKKYKGTYYTLGGADVFDSDSGYDKDTNPNLIPGNRWMRLKSEVLDLDNGDVSVTLYLDKKNNGQWEEILSVIDENGKNGGAPIQEAGYAGIRSDYMDLWFDNYKITEN